MQTEPRLVDEPVLLAEGIRHPLMKEDEVIGNPVEVGVPPGPSIIVLSGPNGSGKLVLLSQPVWMMNWSIVID